MDLSKFKKIHLIGIGGINVSAIAKLLRSQGKQLSGSDLVDSDGIRELENLGVRVSVGHGRENITTDVDLVIYSEAVPKNNPERQEAQNRGIKQMSAFQFWGQYSRDKKTIAISGTNGKSTVTAMVGLILEKAGFDPTVVVGTRVHEWRSNIRIGQSDWLVIEADEYHAHMLEFKPHIAVITNILADHLDYYKDLADIIAHFQKWLDDNDKGAGLVINADDENIARLKIKNKDVRKFSLADKKSLFVKFLLLDVPGEYNKANALAAAQVGDMLGIDKHLIINTLNDFKGVWRRFEIVGEFKGATVISDYAHHPEAIKAVLAAARGKYPDKRLLVLYQPHQHNRTKTLFADFVRAFDLADELILAEIYDVPGREQSQDQSVSSRDLVKSILSLRETRRKSVDRSQPEAGPCLAGGREPLADNLAVILSLSKDLEIASPSARNDRKVTYAPDLKSAEELVRQKARSNDVILIIGAGDVDKVARNLITKS